RAAAAAAATTVTSDLHHCLDERGFNFAFKRIFHTTCTASAIGFGPRQFVLQQHIHTLVQLVQQFRAQYGAHAVASLPSYETCACFFATSFPPVDKPHLFFLITFGMLHAIFAVGSNGR